MKVSNHMPVESFHTFIRQIIFIAIAELKIVWKHFTENPRLGIQAKVPSRKAARKLIRLSLNPHSVSWAQDYGTAFLLTYGKSVHSTALSIILRIFFSRCQTSRQSGVSPLQTPIPVWTGAMIEMHRLSGVVSESDGLSTFGKADQRYRR